MLKQAGVLAAVLGLAVMVPAALAAEPITGRWLTAEKDAVVSIAPCGKALCGRIEKFLVAPPQGNDQRDVNNPDAAKRSRKLLGIAILSGLVADGNAWNGQVYDPKKGKTYTAYVRRKPDGTLEMKGCVGPFCQAQVWKRAS
ncbi:MAG: DUF2147 domain-containing protein [Erythrobacter sp.]|uniref:DUF2147 domain-containing protein n=1 Tax=Erythrobacter sp. TaxID=1042 RepID=UPI0025FB3D11|nr:DUF2147 domain-containing protein [Erythrobacter sp.]MCL9998960.1 DUF2147 domain-containing protein [Erythrobacter sp.]